MATIKVMGGGTVTFTSYDSNCALVQNCGPTQGNTCAAPRTVSLANTMPAPPTTFMQPYQAPVGSSRPVGLLRCLVRGRSMMRRGNASCAAVLLIIVSLSWGQSAKAEMVLSDPYLRLSSTRKGASAASSRGSGDRPFPTQFNQNGNLTHAIGDGGAQHRGPYTPCRWAPGVRGT